MPQTLGELSEEQILETARDIFYNQFNRAQYPNTNCGVSFSDCVELSRNGKVCELTESPFLDNSPSYIDDDEIIGSTTSAFSKIDQNKARPVGDFVSVNKTHYGDRIYHYAEGEFPKTPTAVSQISTIDHDTLGDIKVHAYVQKRKNAPSEHVNKLFRKVLREEGTVYSDETQSKGSKKFWMSIHSRVPGVVVHHFDPETNSLHLASPEYLKQNEHRIWSSKDDSAHHHLLSATLPKN